MQNLHVFDFALEADEKVGEVIEALSSGAKESGGSGLAFVTELSDCVKLGTGARGESVL